MKTEKAIRDIPVNLDEHPDFPKGEWARDVLFNGHVPGFLSGACLQGKARTYKSWYTDKIAEVSRWVNGKFSAVSSLHRDLHNARLWTDEDNGGLIRFVQAEG